MSFTDPEILTCNAEDNQLKQSFSYNINLSGREHKLLKQKGLEIL